MTKSETTKAAGKNVLSVIQSRLEFATVVIIGRKEKFL